MTMSETKLMTCEICGYSSQKDTALKKHKVPEHCLIRFKHKLVDAKLKREKEFERIAGEKRLDLLHTLNDMDVKGLFTTKDITAAIVDGVLPHVRYMG